MSLEVTCKICGEEFDMRHGLCPACQWRVKRVAQLEAENKRMKEGLRNEGKRIIKALEDYAKDLDKLSVASSDEAEE